MSSGNYEEKINELVSTWNKEIDESLRNQEIDPDLNEASSDKVDTLIAVREAVRRGLFRIEEDGEVCMSCPEGTNETSPGNQENTYLEKDMEVARGPKSKYGQE